MDYRKQYDTWLQVSSLPENMRHEMQTMAGNEEALKGSFGAQLHFGTAGMRGIMGAGPNRLNLFTVRRAAQGMAAWLVETQLPKSCAIGYDSRHNSRFFAEICAEAFAECGIGVWLFDRLAPTPMLSYAVRQLNCGCGIVISASHNSGEYNGIKCYGPDGCQMTDEPAAIVMNKIQDIPFFTEPKQSYTQLLEAGKIRLISQSLWEDYYRTVLEEGLQLSQVSESDLRVVYTPLCGTGNEPVREILKRIGVHTQVVTCQEQPDGDFKTCEYPNPETDAALRESYRTADSSPCDLILGTDPDCDRIAIAVPTVGGYKKLSGNELGCMLLDYILRTRKEQGTLPDGAEAVRSIVTTPMADRIAAFYRTTMKTVLTGFKYIGAEILSLEEQHQAHRFVFGFEESCGYLKGTYARDKDAVVAAMLVCEMAASLKREGKNLLTALDALYAKFGCFAAQVVSVELSGPTAMEQAADMMRLIRSDTPKAVGGLEVTAICDYLEQTEYHLLAGTSESIKLPKSNVYELILGDSGSIIVRPSGTEPKVKLYFTAVEKTWDEAKALLHDCVVQMKVILQLN